MTLTRLNLEELMKAPELSDIKAAKSMMSKIDNIDTAAELQYLLDVRVAMQALKTLTSTF